MGYPTAVRARDDVIKYGGWLEEAANVWWINRQLCKLMDRYYVDVHGVAWVRIGGDPRP